MIMITLTDIKRILKIVPIVWIVVLTIIVVIGGSEYVKRKNEIKRLESNIKALQTEVVRSKTTDGKNAYTAKAVTLTKSELKEDKAKRDELKTMNIKPRDVKSMTQATVAAEYNVKLRDTVIDTVVCYRYSDAWVDININDDSASIQTRDSITIVNHAKTKRFLWWTWKKYTGETTVKNYSPYSTITTLVTTNIE